MIVFATGSRCESNPATRMVNDSPPRTCRTIKIMPKIVENQCGSRDMIQSIEKKVTVRP